jgi:putative ABC transport system ATP-binding protein
MVEIKDVHKQYFLGVNPFFALQGVSLSINKGEFLALAGTSGSGKTTLLNLIGCLDVPTQGLISIEGQDSSKLNEPSLASLRAHTIGFIFQTFNLLPVLTAFENVEYPLIKVEKDPEIRRNKVVQALTKVGLKAHIHHRPDQLSGGQRQRVAIARALIHSPKLVVADEPTANLDRKTSLGILELLGQLNQELGQTIIIASHDQLVLNTCKRVVELSDGRIVA